MQIFGTAVSSEGLSVGRLGLAPSPDGWASYYPHVLDNLALGRAINSRAFSLDLRSVGAEDGMYAPWTCLCSY